MLPTLFIELFPRCANAATTYKELVAYAIQKLSQSNVYLYLDAGHAGWLGWSANIQPAAQMFAGVLTQAGGTYRVRGLATSKCCVAYNHQKCNIERSSRRRQLQRAQCRFTRSDHSRQ
jgi:cellulase/cellobiase CelA1